MPYLTGRAENRFDARMNTFREGNSPQLTCTIKAVKTYLVEPTAHRIRDVKFCWVAWKVQRPHEFGRKGEEIRTIFEAEMLTEYRMRGIKVDPDPVPPPQLILPDPPRVVINNWRYTAEKGAKLGMAGASVGVSAAGTAIGQGLGSAATRLALGTGVHDMIANHVLPYVIYQKDRKFKRRAFGAVPIIGSLEPVRGVGNYLYKKAKGKQGNLRHHAACWLAAHLVTCDCVLAQAIVKELYSGPEMEWLKGQEYRTAIEHIERKLKST